MAVTYIELILPALKNLTSTNEEMIVAGGDFILSEMEGRLQLGGVSLQTLSHENMQRAILSCRRFISVPGIGSIYESASARTPTYFLPPTNLTQFLQAECLLTHLNYPHLFLPFPSRADTQDSSKLVEDKFIDSLFNHYQTHRYTISARLKEFVKLFKRDIEISTDLFECYAERLCRIMTIGNGPSPVELTVEQLCQNGNRK